MNALAAPVDVPVTFKITASSVMNSFFIPALAGQIYAMPGMQTELHAVMNRAGDYDGFSANYSGAGFSDMVFNADAVPAEKFAAWVTAARSGPVRGTGSASSTSGAACRSWRGRASSGGSRSWRCSRPRARPSP